MKLRKQRRRTIRAMLWRQPVWMRWAPIGIPGTNNGDGTFTFENLTPLTKWLVQVRYVDDDGVVRTEAQAVSLAA